MPRKARDFYISDFYHIMIQGDEKKFIFKKSNYKEKFIYLLKHNAFKNDIKLIAYCVMDNHVHILVHCKEIERISKMMLQCNTSYGKFFSNERKNVGHVFRDRYRSEPIYTKEYLMNCIKYIHENPIKSNMVKECRQYQYSSYKEYLNETNPIYENIKDVCDFTDVEYNDLIENSHTEIEYMDDDMDGKRKMVFDEIIKEYDVENLQERDIVEIYEKITQRCEIKKSQMAKLLNMKRTTFLNKLKKNGYLK